MLSFRARVVGEKDGEGEPNVKESKKHRPVKQKDPDRKQDVRRLSEGRPFDEWSRFAGRKTCSQEPVEDYRKEED